MIRPTPPPRGSKQWYSINPTTLCVSTHKYLCGCYGSRPLQKDFSKQKGDHKDLDHLCPQNYCIYFFRHNMRTKYIYVKINDSNLQNFVYWQKLCNTVGFLLSHGYLYHGVHTYKACIYVYICVYIKCDGKMCTHTKASD